MSIFNPKRGQATVNTIAPAAPPPAAPQPDASIDTSKWERMDAVVDSGSTVPVLNPKTGKAYPVEESAASRAGVEYECANEETVPNLGQKRMAVLTEEGTLRAYGSQCADSRRCSQQDKAPW